MLKKLTSTRLNAFVSAHLAVLILRVGAAALIMTHGYPKMMSIMEGNLSFGDPLGLGPEVSLILVAFAEFVCAAFVMIGLGTRYALVPLLINMSVIVFVAHADDPFGRKELGIFFMISFVVLFLTGPGRYSLDRLVFGR
ncbi:MAG: DoxX family protein [Balneolaceae bacterium]